MPKARAVWYVVNLATKKLEGTFEGPASAPPQRATNLAERVTNQTGDTCVVALGRLWTQLD